MRKLLILCVLLAAVPARADFNPAGWQYRRALSVPAGAEFGEAVIDRAVYARTGASLDSLRVVADGQEIPYVIVSRPPRDEWRDVAATRLNETRDDGLIRVELDCGVSGRTHDRVRIQLTGGDYRVPVKVEGSRDRTDWQTLRDGAYILHYSGDQSVTVDEVRYFTADFRYLRLTVSAVPAGYKLGAVSMARRELAGGDLQQLASMTGSGTVRTTPRGRESEFVVDCGVAGVPQQQVQFNIEGTSNYQREVEILGSENGQRYARVGGGVIYRYGQQQETVLNFPVQTGRFIKLIIRNYDDQPLPVSEVIIRGVPQRMVYRVALGGTFLYYGNVQTRAPRYDLAAQWRANNVPAAGAPAEFGAEETNPAFVAAEQPLTETRPWLIYFGLGLGVAVLGTLAVKLLRSPAGPRDEARP